MQTSDGFGRRLPMDFCGDLFRRLSPMVVSSVRMAIEGSSSHPGPGPGWLRRTTDLRVLGWEETERGGTVLHIEAPPFGEAAEEIYKQSSFWDTRPAPDDTALNVFARAAKDVREGNRESSLYDLGLLKRFGHADRLFSRQVQFLDVPESRAEHPSLARLDRDVALFAQQLTLQTPASRQVRVSGRLDMIRHSTRSFEMWLSDGKRVRGILERAEEMELLQSLLGKNITVAGKAIYRPSGSVLRIDAQGVEAAGAAETGLFTRVPPPLIRTIPSARTSVDRSRNWMDSFFGSWPGEESDDELLALLREVRG